MREIIFRGMSKDRKWYFGDLQQFKSGLVYIQAKEAGKSNFVIPETVGQFTGSTDKNGKKIFEGDIMPVWEDGEKYLYKVVYCGDCFMLSMLDSEQGSYPLSIKHSISEVIGNIHDNTELLEAAE